jgi:hypothetical protein
MNNQVKSTWTVGVKASPEQIQHLPITNNEPFRIQPKKTKYPNMKLPTTESHTYIEDMTPN